MSSKSPNFPDLGRNPLPIIVLLILVVLSGYYVLQCFGYGDVQLFPAAIAGGIQVNSISSIPQIVSSDPKFSFEEAWAVDFTLSEASAQELVGVVPKERLSDEGEQAEYGFTFNARMDRQTCNYPIETTGNNIYSYSWDYMLSPDGDINFNKFTEGSAANEAFDQCRFSADGIAAYQRSTTFDYQVLCFKRNKVSTVGAIKSPVALFEATMKVNLNGKTYTDTIKSAERTSANFYEGNELVAYSLWQGDLWSGRNCPVTADYRASFRNGQWTMISEDAYTLYQANIPTASQFKYCVENPLFGEPQGVVERFDFCTDRYNIYTNNALKTPNVLLESDLGGAVSSTQFKDSSQTDTSGQFIIDLTRPISFPKFTLYVKKSFVETLGIRQKVGVPEIGDVVPKLDATTGQITELNVVASNIGDEEGGFTLYVFCDDYGLQYGDSQKVTIDAGDSANVRIPITTSCNILSEGDCKVVMESTANVLLKDEKGFTLVCEPLKECEIVGEQRCEGKAIVTCGEDNSWHTTQVCDFDCTELRDPATGIIRASCESGVIPLPNLCGNGICEPGEASSFFGLLSGSCPQDCESESNMLFVGFLIVFLGVFSYIAFRGYAPGQPYNFAYMLVGLLAGFASIYILKLIVDSILWIALGLTGAVALMLLIGGVPLVVAVLGFLSPKTGARVLTAKQLSKEFRRK